MKLTYELMGSVQKIIDTLWANNDDLSVFVQTVEVVDGDGKAVGRIEFAQTRDEYLFVPTGEGVH